MKLKLFILLVCFFSLTVAAQNKMTHLVIMAKDGTKVTYAFEDIPKVTFTQSDVVITTKNLDVKHPLHDMDFICYEANDVTGINDIMIENKPFRFVSDSLIIPKLKSNSTVSIYNMGGSIVLQKTIQKEGDYAISLSNLETGIYIVTVNGLSQKIEKR